jgi:hypothetical protein
MDGTGRLTLTQPQQAVDVESLSSSLIPVHRIQADASVRTQFQDALRRAFNIEVTVDPPGRMQVELRVGAVDLEEPLASSPEYATYVRAIGALPPINNQGDGLKAYTGIVLAVFTQKQPYTFIDEPEAFLHPPQARELGRLLSKLAHDEEHQVFVATHSRDFVLGSMEHESPPTIVRLVRAGDGPSRMTALSAERLNQLWRDPIIRFSNALDGIFYAVVVVAEDDSDCRWFQAVLTELNVSDLGLGREVLFVPAGGKDRVPTIVEALRGLGVDARASLDFDAFRTPRVLKRLVEANGGNWETFASRVNSLSQQIATLGDTESPEQFADRIRSIVSSTEDSWSSATLQELVLNLQRPGGWALATRSGAQTLRGDVHSLANDLIAELDLLGIAIIPSGAAESFVPQAAGHGPKWVSAALGLGAHKNNGPTVAHLRRLLAKRT